MPPLLPRFYRRLQEIEEQRKLGRILLEVDGPTEVTASSTPATRSASGHDRARMRGLPLIGRGVSGTAPGTSPLGELLRKEQTKRLR